MPTGGSAYGIPKNDSYSSIWNPGVARPSTHPSEMHTIGNTLVKLSSVSGGDASDSTLLSDVIGVLDDEMTVGFDAFESPTNSNTINQCK